MLISGTDSESNICSLDMYKQRTLQIQLNQRPNATKDPMQHKHICVLSLVFKCGVQTTAKAAKAPKAAKVAKS